MTLLKKNKLSLLVAFTLFFIAGSASAQETMMDAVSNVYLEKLIATAKENYPRINTFKSQVAIAKTNIVSQKSTWLDGLSFNYIYKPDNTLDIVNPTFFNGYQIAVSFSVTELFQKGSNVRQAKEGLKMATYQQEEYMLNIETQVKTRYYAFILAKAIYLAQSRSYEDAKNTNTDTNAKFAKGQITFDQYNQAQISLSGSLVAKLTAESNYLTTKASLEELTVKKLEEIQ